MTTQRNRRKTKAINKQQSDGKAARLAEELRTLEENRGKTAHVPASEVEDAAANPNAADTETADTGKIDAETADIDKLRAERDEYLNLARRERAEMDNYRKRVERDRQNAKRENLAGFLKDFFSPLDDLARIINESSKEHSFETLHTGVRMLEENLWKVLAKAGITKIDAQGKPFNPEFHEAMAAVPSADVPPNTVLEVYDNGYILDEFVLKPARVVVSREP